MCRAGRGEVWPGGGVVGPRHGHRAELRPLVGRGVVAFDAGVGARLRVARAGAAPVAAADQDGAIVQQGRGVVGAWFGQGRGGEPAVGRRIVALGLITAEGARAAGLPAANDQHLAGRQQGRGVLVMRARGQRRRVPGVRRRGVGRAGADQEAAERQHPAIGQRRRGEIAQLGTGIGCHRLGVPGGQGHGVDPAIRRAARRWPGPATRQECQEERHARHRSQLYRHTAASLCAIHQPFGVSSGSTRSAADIVVGFPDPASPLRVKAGQAAPGEAASYQWPVQVHRCAAAVV